MLLRRRTRFIPILLITAVFVIVSISILGRAILKFQLNKEVIYYRKYFNDRKDGIQTIFNPLEIKQIPSETIDSLYKRRLRHTMTSKEKVDWAKFAYVNYVNDPEYLCNTLVMFTTLRGAGTKAKMVLLLSNELVNESSDPEQAERTSKLLKKLNANLGEQLVIKYIDSIIKSSDSTQWSKSLTKLLVFNETDYSRVIFLDNDALLKDSMDELFFIPDYIKFAAPLTYWFLSELDISKANEDLKSYEKKMTNLNVFIKTLDQRISKDQKIYNHLPNLPPRLFLNTRSVAEDIMSYGSKIPLFAGFRSVGEYNKLRFASNVMVITPSTEKFNFIMQDVLPIIKEKKGMYDMDVINDYLYNLRTIIPSQFSLFRRLKTAFVPQVMVLPFSRYGILTGSISHGEQHSIIKNDILGYKRLDENGEEPVTKLTDVLENTKYMHFSDYPIGKPWQYDSIGDFKCHIDMKNKDVKEEKALCKTWLSTFETCRNQRKMCN